MNKKKICIKKTSQFESSFKKYWVKFVPHLPTTPNPLPLHSCPWPCTDMHLWSLSNFNQILVLYASQDQFYLGECVHLLKSQTMTLKCFVEWLHYCQMLHSTKPGMINIQAKDASFNYMKHQSASHMK